MALFINVDPVPPRWWKRKVYRGWQFGYSGGTKNDFMMDVEVARWRFVCYVGFKYPQNPSPRQERHEKWRKEQERARERANRPEPAFRRFWRSLRGAQASGYRVDQKQSTHDHAPTFAEQLLAAKRFLRLLDAKNDHHDKRRRQLAAWPGLSESVLRDATPPFKGVVLCEEHKRSAPADRNQKESETVGLPKEPNA